MSPHVAANPLPPSGRSWSAWTCLGPSPPHGQPDLVLHAVLSVEHLAGRGIRVTRAVDETSRGGTRYYSWPHLPSDDITAAYEPPVMRRFSGARFAEFAVQVAAAFSWEPWLAELRTAPAVLSRFASLGDEGVLAGLREMHAREEWTNLASATDFLTGVAVLGEDALARVATAHGLALAELDKQKAPAV